MQKNDFFILTCRYASQVPNFCKNQDGGQAELWGKIMYNLSS